MKILFYTNDLVAGGAERVMSILANNMVRMGHQVSFLLVSPKKQHDIFYPLDEHINLITHTHSVSLTGFSSNKKLLGLLRNSYKIVKPDAVLCFFPRIAPFIEIATIGLHAKIIYSLRTDPYSISRKNRLYDMVSAFFASKVVCQSEKAKHYYPPFIRKKISVIKNPLELDKLPTDNAPGREKTIVAVGRLIPSKNYDMLLEAFSLVCNTISEYKLKIYGEGSMRQHLGDKVCELHLSDRVIFMGNDPNVLTNIANSALFIMCSEYEGMPNALVEALCLGLPCISTNYSPGGIDEIIVHNENGLIIKRGDVKGLSEEILRVLGDNSLRESLSKNAVLFREKVDSKVIAQQWLEFIKQ